MGKKQVYPWIILLLITNDRVTLFVLSTLLHHFGMSWIIKTHEQLKNYMGKHNPDWITSGPWYDKSIC